MKTAKIQNIYSEIEEVLKKDKRLLDQKGKEIVKNKLTELIIKLDRDLIKILSKNKHAKEAFFVDIDGILVFDKQKFLDFANASEFLPKSYTAFENQIGLSVNKTLLSNSQEVVLDSPYKDCILEGGQEKIDEKRDEVFYNTVLAPDEIDRLKAPKVLTNWKKYDKKGAHDFKEWSGNENLIIRGNNLLALYSLLPKYRGQVKLIYIDPPYNTGNDDFKYNDKFNHSSWLVFMKNRLEVAKELLKECGVIFVQCNDIEQAYLKILLDEIFERKNFVGCLCVEMSPSSGVKRAHKDKGFIKNKEYLLVYKNNDALFDPLYDEWKTYDSHYGLYFDFDKKKRGTLRDIILDKFPQYKGLKSEKWIDYEDIYNFIILNSQNIFRKHGASGWAIENIDNGKKIFEDKKTREKIIKVNNPNDVDDYELLITTTRRNGEVEFDRLEPLSWNVKDNKIYTLRGDLWLDFDEDMGNVNKEGDVKLNNGKKPERLLMDIIKSSTVKNDIVLDYHLGSGTTCAVAHKMGLRYIGIEQLDYGENDSVSRLNNVIQGDNTGISEVVNWKGGGSFVYAELLEWNKKYVDQIEKAKTSKELLKTYNAMKKEAFFRYEVDTAKFDNKVFAELKLKDQKQVLMDCLDANHLYVNYSEIDDATYAVDKKDKKFNREFYK